MTAYEIREQEFYPFEGKSVKREPLELLYKSRDKYGSIQIYAMLPVFESHEIRFFVRHTGLHVSCSPDEWADEIWPLPKKIEGLRQNVKRLTAWKKKF